MFDRRRHHDALHKFIADRKPDLAVTFNLKRALDFYTLQATIKLFMNLMQREIDGGRWYRKPPADRPIAVGMLENADTNPHVHASIYAPTRFVEFLSSNAAEELWQSCHPRCGQLDVSKPKSIARWAGYQIKKAYGPEALDRMILYVPEVRAEKPPSTNGNPPRRAVKRPLRRATSEVRRDSNVGAAR